MELKTQLTIFRGMQLYSEGGKIEKGYIKIKDQKIAEFGSIDHLKIDDNCKIVDLPSNYRAIPGFIDVHIHGANGADMMDGTKEALDTIATALPKEGTTSFLATTITQEKSNIETAVINAGQYIRERNMPGKAEILGIHLEGPFINPIKAGAQPKRHIIDPDIELMNRWSSLSNNSIRIVTLAPESPGGSEMIHYLKEQGIIASIGHTDAGYDQVVKAVQLGAVHVTHLFNQMKGMHHREPGTVGAAFLQDALRVELIADGVHVHPEMAKMVYKIKGQKGIILITDSMRAKCLKNGDYDLGGQVVTVKDGKAVLSDGTLAGSILRMDCAVKNFMDYTGCSIGAVIEVASVNPAKQLNIYSRKGSIGIGKDADIVILNENLEIFLTLCRGTIAFTRLT